MKNQGFLAKLVHTVLSIAEEITSIIIALALIVLEKVAPSYVTSDILLIAILSIVVLLAISNLRDRLGRSKTTYEKIVSVENQLEQHIFDSNRASNFFSNTKIEVDQLAQAKEIVISGISLVKTIGTYHEAINKAITNGASVKILLLDGSSSDCINQLIKRSWGKVSEEYYKRRISSTDEQIRIISENIKSSSHIRAGSLEVGKIQFVPSFGIIAINCSDDMNGKANIEIYHHLTNNPSPSFLLEKPKDHEWFDFFIRQFYAIWDTVPVEKLIEKHES